MLGRTLTIGVLATMAVTLLATAAAAEDKSPAQAQEHIYGSHLMTEQEHGVTIPDEPPPRGGGKGPGGMGPGGGAGPGPGGGRGR